MDKESLLNVAQQFLQSSEAQKILSIDNKALDLFNSKPELKKYNITGRVYNKNTGETIQGANVEVKAANANPVKTNSKGIFTIEVEVPILPENGKILSPTFLIINSEGLLTSLSPLFTLDREIILDVGTIALTDPEAFAKENKEKFKQEITQKVSNVLASQVLSIAELGIASQRSFIASQVNKTFSFTIPSLLEIISLFGVATSAEIQEQSRPSKEIVKDIIKRRNNLAKQINQIFTTIITNSILAFTYQELSSKFKLINFNISSIQLPLQFATYNVVSTLQKIEDLLNSLSDEFDNSKKQLLVSLVFLIIILIVIVISLLLIDTKIKECAENLGENELEEINGELLSLSQSQIQNEDNRIPSLNGFEFEVVTIPQSGKVPQRQAIAKNSQGVILLKGEPSFSAGDQILIDELKFYIKTNNLKAS